MAWCIPAHAKGPIAITPAPCWRIAVRARPPTSMRARFAASAASPQSRPAPRSRSPDTSQKPAGIDRLPIGDVLDVLAELQLERDVLLKLLLGQRRRYRHGRALIGNRVLDQVYIRLLKIFIVHELAGGIRILADQLRSLGH